MRLSEIRTFVAIIEVGSIVGAARQLKAPPATVSKRLKDLETRLGVTLIERTTHSVRITEWGRTFYPHALATLDAATVAAEAVARLKIEPEGHLRLQAPSAFGQRFIAPHLAEFRALYPRITVSLLLDTAQADFSAPGMDAAIQIGPAPDSDLRLASLGRVPMRLVASPAWAAGHPAPSVPSDLEACDIVAVSRECVGERWEFDRGGVKAVVDVLPVVSVYNPISVQDIVLAGGGVALLSDLFCADAIASGALVTLLQDWKPRAWQDYAIVYPAAHTTLPRVRLFVDFLVARLRPLGQPLLPAVS